MNETRVVPVEATEAQWNGLARSIVMWFNMERHTGAALFRHLDSSGVSIPDWLRKEVPDTEHVPPKGTVATIIYKAMVYAAPPIDAAQVSEMVRTAPARIWIDVSEDEDHHDEPFPDDVEYVAWSMTRGAASAVEYVRADIAPIDAAQADDARDGARWRKLCAILDKTNSTVTLEVSQGVKSTCFGTRQLYELIDRAQEADRG